MTSGGLAAIDIGDLRTIGGIAREFFTRLVEVSKERPRIHHVVVTRSDNRSA